MIPCFLPGLTFAVYAMLLQLGLSFSESFVPFCIAEAAAGTAAVLWRNRLDKENGDR